MIKGLVAGVGALALSLGLAAQASAITFNYEQLSGFARGTQLPPDGGTVTGDAADGIKFFGPNVVTTQATVEGLPAGLPTYRSMAWGNGSDFGVFSLNEEPSYTTLNCTNTLPPGNCDKSGLKVIGQSGTISPGQTKLLSNVQHRNQTIGDPTLIQADIFSLLTIKDSTNTTTLLENANSVQIKFFETNNNPPGNLAGCDAAIQFTTTACDDYFLFPIDSFASVHFIGDDGNGYTLIFSTQCTETSGTRCDVPLDPTTGRIRTAEGAINSLDILITLVADVPAPASLLLLGLGLLGAGIARKKIA
jgi:hypothetical protein